MWPMQNGPMIIVVKKNTYGLPDPTQRRVHRMPLPAFFRELGFPLRGDPVIFAAAARLRFFPPRFDVTEPLEPMQNGVKHPVRPLHVPSGQLLHSLDDRVTVAVLFG